jgi:hypothetical protein
VSTMSTLTLEMESMFEVWPTTPGEGTIEFYSKCHVTSDKAVSKPECAEENFQTRGWVLGTGGQLYPRTRYTFLSSV